jgi:pyridoxal phosphate enzyme (YggS family)
MSLIANNIQAIKSKLGNATLIAVSKTKPFTDILDAYNAGQRDFGENYVQELVDKYNELPKDIRWHMIGHLQSNKVKYIAPFVYLIHGIDSFKLLEEVNKQALKNNRIIDCLLQVHIAQEETKFGFFPNEIMELIKSGSLQKLQNVCIKGLMTMGSNTEDLGQVEREFLAVKELFEKVRSQISEVRTEISGHSNFSLLQPDFLSMGMSGDFELAIKCGSNMVRVGSMIFGERNYKPKV